MEIFSDLMLCCWVSSSCRTLLGPRDSECEGIMILHNSKNHLTTKCHTLGDLYLQQHQHAKPQKW